MRIDGKYIKLRRMELGYSLNRLSKMVGVSATMLSKYENGIILEADTSVVDGLTFALQCNTLDVIFTDNSLQCPICRHKVITNFINSNDLSYVICNNCNHVIYFKNEKVRNFL